MYPTEFVLSLDLRVEIQPFTDICMQHHYVPDNVDFSELIRFTLQLINLGNHTPGLDSRIDTLISKIVCMSEANIPNADTVFKEKMLFELEQALIVETNVFTTNLLNNIQVIHGLIRVDNYGFIVTDYLFDLLNVQHYGFCNIKLTKKSTNINYPSR